MTPEDIKAFKLSIEYYKKSLEELITFSNLMMEKFNKLFEEENDGK